MKKQVLYSFACLIAILLLSTNSAQAQYKILGQNFRDLCTYQSITVYSDSSGGTSTLKIELSYGDGQKDTTVTYGYLSRNHNYATPGTYTVKSVLIDGTTWARMDSATMSVAYTGCTLIKGRLYVDNNSNCILDAADDTLALSTKIEVDSSSIAIDTIFGYKTFEYRAMASTATAYSFKVIASASGLSLSCPTTGKLTATSSIGTVVNAGDFGFTCTSAPLDVAVSTVSHAGRHSMMLESNLTSNSCTKTSGTISLSIDSKYSIYYTYPAGATIVGNTATWSYTNLSVISTKYFYVWGSTGATWLTPGTPVTSSVYATPIADADSTNNKATLIDTVTAAWDPNDKQVSPKGAIAAGTTLNYTLSFENTGNAPAKNIHILDTLDINLDENSLQVVTSSHAMKLYTTKIAGGKTLLNFDFPNINLLDSSHHGLCDGFVRFSIKTKSGLANGTVINNRGGIYFDDNDVVLTNTTANAISVLNIPTQTNFSNLLIYPNPAGDYITIKAPLGTYNKVEMMNQLGQLLLQQNCQGNEMQVNISGFIPGIYYVVIRGEQGVQVEKIEKK